MKVKDVKYKLSDLELRYLSLFLGTNEPVIVGLNTFQGINVSSIFSKGLLQQIGEKLSLNMFKPKIIDGCTLMYNKTEHALDFLKSNLSVEEIKELKRQGGVASVRKAMGEMGLLKFFKALSKAYVLTVRSKEGDKDIKMSSEIRDAERPIVIISTGQNDLMREVQANPFAIRKDYKRRAKDPSFNISAKLVQSVDVSKIVDKVGKIQDYVHHINPNAIVVVLSSYKPKSLEGKNLEEHEAFKPFGEMIDEFNERLEESAKEKGSFFVSTDVFEEKEMGVIAGLRANLSGHSALSDKILYAIYNGLEVEDKLANNKDRELITVEEKPNFPPSGIYSLLVSLSGEKYDRRCDNIKIKNDPNASPEAKKVAEVSEQESQMAHDTCDKAAQNLELKKRMQPQKKR